MTISATSNYMSNFDMIAWMEQKTDEQYGRLRSSMDEADGRVDTEKDLNDVKSLILNSKINPGNAAAIHDQIDQLAIKYADDPEVMKLLTPIQTSLDTAFRNAAPHMETISHQQDDTETHMTDQGVVNISEDQRNVWSKNIENTVDDFGKQDQLSMINIQEFNSEINQTKQIASALMDANDKSSNTIINHIA